MNATPLIRAASTDDAAELLDIYRQYVECTAVSFETRAPTVDEFAARIAKALQRWAWLAAVQDGRCIGYAYGSMHRERDAYRWSAEVSAYVHEAHQRRGLAKALYLELFEKLKREGYCNAYAGIALPNDASIALHRSVGFEPIGVFRRVGRKFGAWQDVAWYQLALQDAPPGE